MNGLMLFQHFHYLYCEMPDYVVFDRKSLCARVGDLTDLTTLETASLTVGRPATQVSGLPFPDGFNTVHRVFAGLSSYVTPLRWQGFGGDEAPVSQE